MKSVLAGILLFATLALNAQSLRVRVEEGVPEAAAAVLQQRFTQLIEAGGMTAGGEEAPELLVSAVLQDRMEVPGDKPQVMVLLTVTAVRADVSGNFSLRGVGADDADAWERAARQILPKSKAARELAARLKESLQE